PSRDQPLVYHLFGRYGEPDSLVLTEDDCFDFLTAVARAPHLVPDVVRYALSQTALMFLGFRIEDSSFRALFRCFAALAAVPWPGRAQDPLAVSPDLDEDSALDAGKVRRYVRQLLGDARLSVYWGDADDFTLDLAGRFLAPAGMNLAARP